ncbi:MAG: hypothetical protein SCALA702_23160 [Melioribacteraceae bacterium]|nr:MAG: hypothetical protein SCALA702_23160 [Melioribacteraceae bacterium]
MEFSKIAVILLAAIILLTAGFLVWHFFFSIYELKPQISPGKKIVPRSNVTISYIPLNVWGYRVPFRDFEVEFSLEKNVDLIDTPTISRTEKSVSFKVLDKPGEIVIHSNSEYFLSTNVIKIEIGEYNE